MGIGGFVLLTLILGIRAYPFLKNPVAVEISFPRGEKGRTEPIFSTGIFERADFLGVHYLDDSTAEFIYDSWGAAAVTSPPFTLLPTTTRTLSVEMPSLAAPPDGKSESKGLLRISLDGRELMRTEVHFYRRNPGELYFGLNPIGGNTGGAVFRGRLVQNGRTLVGGPEAYFGWRQRFLHLFRAHILQAIWAALGAALLGLAGQSSRMERVLHRATQPATRQPIPPRTSAPHLTFALTAAACTLVFTALITQGKFDLFVEESFGVFYDHQAASLLKGRLDVPESALSGEAFIFEGKTYGYFGPTPAILRLPLIAAGIGFGKLSRVLMVAYYIAALVATYSILGLATELRCGRGAWPSRWATIAFVALTGLGSTLLFLGSRAYIYHEAILCGASFALWSAYWTLRYAQNPNGRAYLGALLCGIAAVHARPPVGLFALSFVGVVAIGHAIARKPDGIAGRRRRHGLIGGAAIAGVLSFNVLSYLKFETFEGCPLRLNVQYNPERLARIDGRQFHLSNVGFGLAAYVTARTVQSDARFPYFHQRDIRRDEHPLAKLDIVEPMTGLPWAMPALSVLAVIGLFNRRQLSGRANLAAWISIVPMSVALFAAIAVSQRYTGDFVPFLIVAAAFGLVFLDAGAPRWRRIALGAVSATGALSCCITLALALHFQAEVVWGLPKDVRENYRALQQRVDGFFGVAPR